jgi:hypothetical protein
VEDLGITQVGPLRDKLNRKIKNYFVIHPLILSRVAMK